VRWTLAGPDRDAYLAGHLPGAVFVDLDTELAGPPGGPDGLQGRHPLPEPGVLQHVLRRAGVHPGTPVVVYGERDTSVAARAWWLLRWAGLDAVTVLDGGYRAWSSAGLPVQTGEPRPVQRAGTVTVSPGGMPVVDADRAAGYGSGAGSALLDARAPERYRGETEPMDPVAGHIPGAANVPLAAVHGPDGRMLPPDELAGVLDAAGAVTGAPAAASCGSGVTACSLILAGEVVGRHLALYPGSYSGWCALGRPVATG
jgi:thiosulfate/3-mercaptopyruvate sulfurtransferase